MNFAMVSNLLGRVLLCEGGLLAIPLAVSLIYREYLSSQAFLVTIAISLAIGLVLLLKKPKDRVFHLKEGFVVTALSWIVISIVGAIPFLYTGVISDPVSAIFEVVSGFTTTGASILKDVEVLPKSLLFWRSFTHWIGGMGVLVFLLTLLPLAGGSRMNLMKAESPGPQVEKLVPKVQSTAKILYGLYISLTALQLILLLIGKMPFFDAITITFGTAGTGGFAIKNSSIADYSAYIQIVVTAFMILFAINFNLYFLLMHKKVKRALAMEEFHWFLAIVVGSILIIAFNVQYLYNGFWHSLQQSAFQVAAIISTTGYATTDFNLWPSVSKTILVMLMFVGACAGSTGGGIKVSRIVILAKTFFKELKLFLHPNRVGKISMDKKIIPHEVVRATNVFMVSYILVFSVSLLLIAFDEHDLVTNFTAIAATINNIGPGLEMVGPTQNFATYSSFSKIVLIFDMLAGRLELFPLLLLFTKDTWQKF